MKINMTREGLLEFVRNLRSQWGFAPVSRNQIAKEWVEAIDAAADVIETLTGGPLSDIEKVQHMEKCNWKPASTYWMERYNRSETACAALKVALLSMEHDRDEWRQRAADRCEEAEKWFRKYGAEQERADNTQRALDALQHASDGFAEAVRQESGKAYPWPALELAADVVAELDGYVIWEGGDRPVDSDTIVDVKIASGVPRVPVRAGEWPQICWRHRPMTDPKSGWNIVAYRVVG